MPGKARRVHPFFRNRSALVTGATSGIGEELAMQLAVSGAKLTLAARRSEELARVSKEIVALGLPEPLNVVCDVARDGDCERAVADVLARHGALDVVFANAGFGVVGSFEKLTLEDYRRQLETNVFGVLRTLQAALPEIK